MCRTHGISPHQRMAGLLICLGFLALQAHMAALTAVAAAFYVAALALLVVGRCHGAGGRPIHRTHTQESS